MELGDGVVELPDFRGLTDDELFTVVKNTAAEMAATGEESIDAVNHPLGRKFGAAVMEGYRRGLLTEEQLKALGIRVQEVHEA
tara:strand:- start:53 stop:301 length:249 start_codon:yes stop_codon:yes gene_type:complete